MSQINLQHGTTTKKRKTGRLKTDMIRSIGKQSGESMVAMVGKI